MTPELILALFIPPLIFEASFRLNLDQVVRNLPTILLLAVPGVIVTTAIVGGVVWLGGVFTLPLACLLGAIVAATDPVSVVAVFRRMGVPWRLAVLVEGESLLNDGTAIVFLNLVLAVVLTGNFTMSDAIIEFFIVAGGGTILA